MEKYAKISLILGFLSAIIAYTFYPFLDRVLYPIMVDEVNNISGKPIPDGLVDFSCYYKLIAFSFCAYTFTIYRLSIGRWSLLSLVIFLTASNAMLDELFFNPISIEYNEYIGFIVTIIITYIFRHKWERH